MRKILIAFVLLAGTMIMFFLMRPSAKKLYTPQTHLGILDLEFAYNNSHVSNILHAWQGDRIEAAKINTYIDFGLLIFYSVFLFYCCKSLAINFYGNTRRIGLLLSNGALIAGALDIIENTGMLITLGGHQQAFIAMVTAFSASIKWIIAIMGILYILFMSPFAIYQYYKHKKQLSLK
jgi:hypothetical protein